MNRLFALLLLSACADPVEELATGTLTQAQVLQVPGQISLADALLQAEAGDTIRIGPGVFADEITVEVENLIIEGAGEETILERTINVKRPGFRLSDLRMRSSGSPWGVHSNGHALRVERVSIEGYSFGLGLFDTNGESLLDGVTIQGNQWGVYTRDTNLVLRNCVLSNNTKAGFFSRSGVRVRFFHNTVVGNGFANPGEISGGVVTGPGGVEEITNNIIVGNHQGVNCQDCGSSYASNDVWGNVTDYFGGARRAAGDLAVDPRFVNPAQRDFRLRADSPCIDAGRPVAVESDGDGHPRPAGSAPDLGAYEHQPATAALVITEGMATPRVERSGEFIELFNAGDEAVDLAGYHVTDGDSIDPIEDAGAGTLLEAGAYALVLDRDFDGDHEIPAGALRVGVDDASLGNGLSIGDPVRLIAPDRNTIVSAYAEPFDPGDGRSAERVELDGSAFVPSPCGASPGRANCIAEPEPEPAALLITEVMSNPLVERSGEYVELMNLGEAPIDLAGFRLSDGDREDVLQGFDGDAVVPGRGGFALIVDADYEGQYDLPAGAKLLTTGDRTLGNALSTNDPITLRDPAGVLVGSYSHPLDAGNGRSVELVSLESGDRAGNWVASPCGLSPARENCAWEGAEEPAPRLVITEIMANPLDEDTGEYVELFNPGEDPVDAAGLILDDGDASDTLEAFGGSSVIPPGGYAVVLDPEYAGEYDIPAEAIRLRPDDTTIGSGLTTNDPVELRAGAERIDLFDAPYNPGNGVALELRDGAWLPSECEQGGSPGRESCEDAPVARPEVIINEVMANPIDENTGEFVELLNLGGAPVDLAGFVLDDGDAVDRLEGWEGGPTILPAGGYAVILDRGYAEQYEIVAGALRLTVGDARLGSGIGVRDPVRLLMPDGLTELSRFAPPFDPGNGRSAERETAEGDSFISAQCVGEQQASPGGRNCIASEGDPRDCRARADCPPGHQCMGIPQDGSTDLGRCTDLSNREGEGQACAAHEDCGEGLVCGGLSIWPESAECKADYHHGVYTSRERLAIPDNRAGGVSSELIVYGLATVPLDMWLTLDLDHPAKGQLRVVLEAANGQEVVVFNPGLDPPSMLNDPISLLAIFRDDTVNGRYTLRVSDGQDGGWGHLNGWSLEIISNFD